MIRSMKWRLILGLLLGWTVIYAVGAGVVYLNTVARMYEKFDSDLMQRAESIESMVRYDVEDRALDIEWEETGLTSPPGHEEGRDYCKLMESESGKVWHLSGGLKGSGPPKNREFEGKIYPVTLQGGAQARCVEFWFYPEMEIRDAEDEAGDGGAGRKELLLFVAKRDSVAQNGDKLKEELLTFWVLSVACGGVMIYLVVGLNLKPLGELGCEIEKLDEHDLSERVALLNTTSELEPVINEINSLLERVEAAFRRERVMTSNVAHELRTPVAGLLSSLEVILSGEREVEEYKASGEECLKIATRMHWLVNNLMSLSRLEAGQVKVRREVVELENELRLRWRPFVKMGLAKKLRLVWEIEKGFRLETDVDYLRVVVRNLFDNAVSYVPEGGTIRITANAREGIVIGNDVVGLDQETVYRVFDPFWRSSEEREGERSHVGLGLSLSKKVVELLGGQISAHLSEDRKWFEVRVGLGVESFD